MDSTPISRRRVLAGGAAMGGATVLAGCVGSGGSSHSQSGGSGDKDKNLTLQINFSEKKTRAATKKIVTDFRGPKTTVNAVATEQFRAKLSTYLTSKEPPDVIGWLAGHVAQDYAKKGLLQDVSDLWNGDGACAKFSSALKDLSSDGSGKQIFVPTRYYWWSIFYKKSAFKKWGVKAPKDWEGFIGLCKKLKSKGVNPLANGVGSTPWMASGWFDYLNLRINGASFHRDLLDGKHSFEDPKVAKVLKEYRRLIPYFDPKMTSYSNQEAVTPWMQDKDAMYLVGADITRAIPDKYQDDIDFFSVPTIDSSIRSAEEAPTDGYMGSANATDPEGGKKLMTFLASPKAQKKYILKTGEALVPTSPEVDTSDFSPLVQKGVKLLENTRELTQFFNRDSSDELQKTADTALTKFLDDPSDIPATLKSWQAAAKKVWNS